MNHFKTALSNGVLETFVTMGVIYFMYMMIGVDSSGSAEGWQPEGWTRPVKPAALVTQAQVAVDVSLAYAAVLAAVVVLWHERHRRHRRVEPGFADDPGNIQRPVSAEIAASFVGLLSLFNMVGRFFWRAPPITSPAQHLFRVLRARHSLIFHGALDRLCGLDPLFVAAFVIILVDVRGRLRHIPRTCANVFGTMHVGAIHGRLLTAWSAAGVLGPVLINYIREYQIERGVPKAQAYSVTMYIMLRACSLSGSFVIFACVP